MSAATEIVDLSEGGIATVILSSEFQLPNDYAYHKQLLCLSLDQVDGTKQDVDKRIPPSTKIVLLSDGIPGFQFRNIQEVCRHRGIPYLTRRNQTAMDEALKELNIPLSASKVLTPSPVAKQAKKGSVKEFIDKEANLRCESIADEARRIWPKAVEQGIETTIGSLAQGISKARRDKNMGTRPMSAMTKQQQALSILDQAIENLTLIREYVSETEAENGLLKSRLKIIEDAIGRG